MSHFRLFPRVRRNCDTHCEPFSKRCCSIAPASTTWCWRRVRRRATPSSMRTEVPTGRSGCAPTCPNGSSSSRSATAAVGGWKAIPNGAGGSESCGRSSTTFRSRAREAGRTCAWSLRSRSSPRGPFSLYRLDNLVSTRLSAASAAPLRCRRLAMVGFHTDFGRKSRYNRRIVARYTRRPAQRDDL
jgi:hypothetical protein